MAQFANLASMGLDSLRQAQTGIDRPLPRPIHPGTILYRFGDTQTAAMRGCWWLEQREFDKVCAWAKAHGLELAHAYRVLCAIAHAYGGMHVLARARVTAPLMGHEGRSRTQRLGGELLAPGESRTGGSEIVQLYIPGLRDGGTNASSLALESTQYLSAGASHIGGVPGIPAGATLQ